MHSSVCSKLVPCTQDVLHRSPCMLHILQCRCASILVVRRFVVELEVPTTDRVRPSDNEQMCKMGTTFGNRAVTSFLLLSGCSMWRSTHQFAFVVPPWFHLQLSCVPPDQSSSGSFLACWQCGGFFVLCVTSEAGFQHECAQAEEGTPEFDEAPIDTFVTEGASALVPRSRPSVCFSHVSRICIRQCLTPWDIFGNQDAVSRSAVPAGVSHRGCASGIARFARALFATRPSGLRIAASAWCLVGLRSPLDRTAVATCPQKCCRRP